MITKIFLTWAVTAAVATACYNPMDKWVGGILFNNGESVDLSIVTGMGKNGVNYIKEGEEEAMKIQYISHYSPKAMVSFGRFKISFQDDIALPRLAIALDTTVAPESFEFDKAIANELDWLISKKVLTVSQAKLEIIKKGLVGVSGGNSQYWTKQDSVLGYNSWFGQDGVNSVRAVKGVFGVQAPNSCGSGVSYKALPESLDQGAAIVPANPLQSYLGLIARPVNSGYLFKWNSNGAGMSSLRISTLSGRTLVHRRFADGVNQWNWNGKEGPANSDAYVVIVSLETGLHHESLLLLNKSY
jgi:hypothetical protein